MKQYYINIAMYLGPSAIKNSQILSGHQKFLYTHTLLCHLRNNMTMMECLDRCCQKIWNFKKKNFVKKIK